MKKRVEKISRLEIFLEPAVNHEMVRAVLTERQTSDCDVKCRKYILVSEVHVYWHQIRWKTSTMLWFCQSNSRYRWRVFIYLGFIFILYDNHSVDRAAKHYGRFTPNFASINAYALSLELTALAVIIHHNVMMIVHLMLWWYNSLCCSDTS